MEQAYPLLDRAPDAALFLRHGRVIPAESFLQDVHTLAETLPEAGHMVNLCRDRYSFAVAFAAGLLRGQTCLLTGDGSAAMLGSLAVQFPGCIAAVDEPDTFTGPLAAVPVRASGTASGPAPNPLIPARQQAAIVFTSGSTGVPVPHRKAWGALVERTRAAGERFRLDEQLPCSVVGTVPPNHMYGFEVTLLLPLHAAAASWCGPAFFPGDVQAALSAVHGPRVLVTTPLQVRALLHGTAGLPPLHACISATAPLDPALAAEAEARWGAPVLEVFGATECGSIASRRTTEGDAWHVYPTVALHHVAAVSTAAAPWAEPVALADELEVPIPGQFRLLGRRTDLVKMGGRRASLAGLNRILTGLDGVSDGIFVIPDDLERRTNARLLAVVVAPGRSSFSILSELRRRMDPLFLPRRVIRVPALPRNELGKLPRQALLALLDEAARPAAEPG